MECPEFCRLTLDWSIQKAGAEIKAPEGKNIPWKGRSLSTKEVGGWGLVFIWSRYLVMCLLETAVCEVAALAV